MSKMTVHHGSDVIIREPSAELRGPASDFGRGFYCTDDQELAGEWACRSGKSGFINRYEWEDEGLKILDLRLDPREEAEAEEPEEDAAENAGSEAAKTPDPEENLLRWLALVVANRSMPSFSREFSDRVAWLKENYLPDVSGYDVIIGYRADDVWFTLIRAFLSDEASIETLKKGLCEANRPVQCVFRSREALAALTFVGTQIADDGIYYPRRKQRDRDVREIIAGNAAGFGDTVPVDELPKLLSSSYLKDAMRTLGEAVDYAVNDCGVPLGPFLELLVAAEVGEALRISDPRVISGLSGVELAREVMAKSGMGVGGPEPAEKTAASKEYRIGRAIACYTVGMGCGLRELMRLISAEDLEKLSENVPEGDEGQWITGIHRKLKRRSSVSRLQVQRKISGLSQRQLAELSGVNIRTLQQYEIRSKDLSKASVSSVNALADVLGCRPEDILELV